MQIARIHIENYRSIRALDFCPSNYCVLIGENNAGKSNILKAINLVLGEMWPTDRTFTQEDFYGQISGQDIVIQVYFDAPLETWKNMSLTVYGFELRCRAYKRAHKGMPKGTLTVDYTCINAKGETVKYPAEPLQEGKQVRVWYDLKVSKDLREHIPFIYVDILRDYHRHDPSNRWSVLRKLLNHVNAEIANDKATVKVLTADGELKMTRKQAFEYRLREAYGYLKTPDFMEIEDKIRGNTLDQMGISQEHGDLGIRFAAYDPVNLFKNLQLFVDQMGVSTSADMVGAGLQSAIVMAIFRTYEEIKKDGAVFAIEGPEVFLHPQKERYFQAVLHSISIDNQVFITTHSPEFVSISRPEEVCLVRRNRQEGTKATLCTKEQIAEPVRKELELQNYFDTQRHEMFFAQGLIFVIGATEKHFMPFVAFRLGLNLNQHGISVIDCGGKGNLLLYTQVADAFRIPYVVMVDDHIASEAGIADPDKLAEIRADNMKHNSKNQALREGVEEERLFWLYPNFAAEMGLPNYAADELKNAIEYIKSHEAADITISLVQPIRRIVELVNKSV